MEAGYKTYLTDPERKNTVCFQDLPLLSQDNISEYESGSIPVGRFPIKRIVESPIDPDEDFAERVIDATLKRAANPADPLYCRHAAVKHADDYLRVLDAFADDDSFAHMYWQTYTPRWYTDSNPGLTRQLVMIGGTKPRDVTIAYPIVNYLSHRNAAPQVIYNSLMSSDIHPASSLLTAIYCGMPNEQCAAMGFADEELLRNLREVLLLSETGRATYNSSAYLVALDYLVQHDIVDRKSIAEIPEFQFVKSIIPARPKMVFDAIRFEGPRVSEELLRSDSPFVNQSTTSISTAYFEYS